MIPVGPLRSSGESLRPDDIPLAHIRQQEPATRTWDKAHRESFGFKQQNMRLSDPRIPMAPCPVIGDRTNEPILEEPEKAEPKYVPKGPEWVIPFILRHRFFNWVYPILEAEFAARADDSEMEYGKLDTTQWKREFLKQPKLQGGKFVLERGWTKAQVYEAADQIRHAAEHRRNMGMIDIRCGLTLPEVFGNEEVYARIMSVFELVCVAGRTTAQKDPQVFQALDKMWGTARSCGTITELYTSFQYIIEGALFRYTERNHPEILADKGWTMPEQGEMPQWEEVCRELTAKQDVFLDPYGHLLSNCLFNARRLRVFAAHRKPYDLEITLNTIHRSLKCLMTLGEFESAIEVEILAEQYLTQNTRDGVLKRLANAYLDEKLPPVEDVLPRRRAERRRVAITRVLKDAPLDVNDEEGSAPKDDCQHPMLFNPPSSIDESPDPSSMAWGFEPQKRSPRPSLPPLPSQINKSTPDSADVLHETSRPSMHPILRTVPVPYSVREWRPDEDEDDDTDISETVDTYDTPDPPYLTSEAQTLKKALADAFEAEMLDKDKTDIPGRPSTGDREVRDASMSDATQVQAREEQTPAGEVEREEVVDDVARYYERVGEQVPRYVHLSIRREIRVYYRKPEETPAVQNNEQEAPVVSEDQQGEPLSKDEHEEPALSEDDQEEPALSDDEQEELSISDNDNEELPAWGVELENPAIWKIEQEELPAWDSEQSFHDPNINSSIEW